jgi:C4-dicarboxylate-specific signal transduction histidine kinase
VDVGAGGGAVSDGADRHVERDGLAFFGAITASVTHELNNVLSIVDQVAGLLGDLAARAARGDVIDAHRLETLQGRIDRQARKGIGIVQHLNRFAHCLDDPQGNFEATEVIEHLLALSERFADLARVRLKRTEWAEWSANGDAFLFQQAVFQALNCVLRESEEGDGIEIGLRRDGAHGVVSISGTAQSTVRGGDQAVRRLSEWMGWLEGDCRVETNAAGGTLVELQVPARDVGSGST